MWKYLNESVEGTSHRLSGTPCQDFSFVTPYDIDGDQLLVAVCADGAGSASESQHGARVACQAVAQAACDFLGSQQLCSVVTEELLREWAKAANEAVSAEAERRGTVARELACTLIFAVLGASQSAFCQIGDGAIVVHDEGTVRPVFWPQNGEYQNSTFFISEPEFGSRLQLAVIPRRVDQIAMFTDGLQSLALNLTSKTAHEPFFRPMFKSLQEAETTQDLIVPMRQFLDSKGVNDRTDDDKTLVLATRVARAEPVS